MKRRTHKSYWSNWSEIMNYFQIKVSISNLNAFHHIQVAIQYGKRPIAWFMQIQFFGFKNPFVVFVLKNHVFRILSLIYF